LWNAGTGTATLCFSGNGIGFGSGINKKWNNEVQIQNEKSTFWETLLLLTLERQDFV
jgi:hypothetical protein